MRNLVTALTAMIVLATAVSAAEPATPARADDVVHKLGFHTAPPLQLEPVGLPSVRAWYRELPPGRAGDQSPWRQLIAFKKDSRTTQKHYFAEVDFEKGTVTELPVMVPAVEAWAFHWLKGKLYIAMNLPARLAVYDPAAGTLSDLGPCFSGGSMTAYRLAVGPDGVIAIGGGTGSDVSLYDPATKAFTHFGQVAAKPGGGTYAYYLSLDENHVYVAVRSSDPWELVCLNRKTKERKVLLTAPVQCHMAINGNVAEVSGDGAKRWYTLADGAAIERPAADRPKPWNLPGPGFTGKPPELAIDESPIIAGEDALTVHAQSPDGKEWRQAKLALRPDVNPLTQLAAMDDGRLVGLPNAYFAMVLVDPKTGATERYPMKVSAYGLLPVGKRIFIAGYPSARTLVFDTTRPMTWEEPLPGRPGVKQEDPAANPHLMRVFGQDTGGAHIGMLLTRGVDGKVYLIARRHRYFYGFSLVWFNPEPNDKGEFATGVFNDQGAFNHLQISTMQPVDGGKQLLITTQVQYNKQLPGQAPESAAVFLFDVAQRKLVGRFEPLPGAKNIHVSAMNPDGIIIGSGDGPKPGVVTLFRLNARTGALETKRNYDWGLGGNLAWQADGKVWGTTWYGNFTVLFAVNTADLTTKAIGRTDYRAGSYCFAGGELFLSGAPQVLRARGVTIPGKNAKEEEDK